MEQFMSQEAMGLNQERAEAMPETKLKSEMETTDKAVLQQGWKGLDSLFAAMETKRKI